MNNKKVLAFALKNGEVIQPSDDLASKISSIGSNNTTLKLRSGTYVISSNLTIPSNVTLYMEQGAILQPENGVTLTINGSIESEPYQIFDGEGTVLLPNVLDFEKYYHWMGLKLYADGESHPITSNELTKIINRTGITNTQTVRYVFSETSEDNEIILPFHTRSGSVITKSDLKVCFDNGHDNYLTGGDQVDLGCTRDGDVIRAISGVSESLYSIDTSNANYLIFSVANNTNKLYQHGAIDITGDMFNEGDEWDYVTCQIFIMINNALMNDVYVSQTTGDYNLDKIVQKQYWSPRSGIYMFNKTLIFGLYHASDFDRIRFNPWVVSGTGCESTLFKGTTKNTVIYLNKLKGSEFKNFAVQGYQNPNGPTAKITDVYSGILMRMTQESIFSNIHIEDCKYGLNLQYLCIFNTYINMEIEFNDVNVMMQRFICQSTFINGQINDAYSHGVYMNGDGGWNNYSIKFDSVGFHYNAGMRGYDNRSLSTPTMTKAGYGVCMKNNTQITFENCYFEGNGTAGNSDVYNTDYPCSVIGLLDKNSNDDTIYNRQVKFSECYFTYFQSILLLKASPGLIFENNHVSHQWQNYCIAKGIPQTEALVNPKSKTQPNCSIKNTYIYAAPPSNWGVLPLYGLNGVDLGIEITKTYPFVYTMAYAVSFDTSTYTIELSTSSQMENLDKIIEQVCMDNRYDIMVRFNPTENIVVNTVMTIQDKTQNKIFFKNVSAYNVTFSNLTLNNLQYISVTTDSTGKICFTSLTIKYSKYISLSGTATGGLEFNKLTVEYCEFVLLVYALFISAADNVKLAEFNCCNVLDTNHITTNITHQLCILFYIYKGGIFVTADQIVCNNAKYIFRLFGVNGVITNLSGTGNEIKFDLLYNSKIAIASVTADGITKSIYNSGIDQEYRPLTSVFDDFLYRTFPSEINTPWILNKGSDASALYPYIESASMNGYLKMTTGDNSGLLSDDGSQIVCAIPVKAEKGFLEVETKLYINSSITGISVNFGLTNTTTLQEPFAVASGDVITSNASDAVCFVYDDGADTKEWFACAVDSNEDDSGNGATGVAPTTSESTSQVLKIQVNSTGNVVGYFINNVLVKYLTNKGVTPDANLYATIVVNSTAASSKAIYVDYLKVSHAK